MASTAEALLRVAKDRGLLDETDSDDDDDGDSAGATMRRSKVPPPEQVKWVGFFTERYVPNMSNLLGVGEIILPTAHSKKSLETTARRAAVKELRRIQDPQQRDEKRPVVWVRWVGDLRSRVTVGRAVTEPADAHLCRPLPHTPQSSYPCLRPDAQQPWERRGVETEGMRYMDGAILNPPNPIDRHSAKIATLCSPKLRSGVHRLSSD